MTLSEVSPHQKSNIITLTTDFGLKDSFVGEMKGAILSVNPHVTIVDITHEIAAHAIDEGAFIIGSSIRYFPEGTIHVAVVDPGVGSERRPIIIETERYCFVGPDNGLFSSILSASPSAKVIHITEEKYMLDKESATFQGRDMFAPVAGWLSKGVPPEAFGPAITDYRIIPIPRPVIVKDTLTGEVIYIDRFGNAITNIERDELKLLGETVEVFFKGRRINLFRFYAQATEGELGCLINSSHHLELFIKEGNAAERFNIKKGEQVVIRKRSP